MSENKIVGWRKICTRCKKEYEEVGPVSPPRVYCDCGGAAFANYPIYQTTTVETTPKPKDGRGWRGDSEGHAAAGRIGGAAAAAIPGHMAAAGRKGGKACADKLGREHMAAIGRKGGSRSSRAKDDEVL